MTITADYLPNIDLGNGVTTIFAVNFPFGAPTDLVVSLFDTVANADVTPAPVLNGGGTYGYTVTGTPNADTGIYPNGSVVFNNPPPATYKVVRQRATPKRQNTQLTNNGPFPAKTVEGTHDRAEMQLQEQSDLLSRAILAPASDGPINMELPPSAVRKGALAQWDATTGALGASSTTISQLEAWVDAVSGAAGAAGSDLWSRPVLDVLSAPPVSPVIGDRYLVAVGATGAWAGFDNQIAEWRASAGWVFSGLPKTGQHLVDGPARVREMFTGAAWRRKNAILDVGEFGAVGSSSVDDVSAVQAGIDWCQTKGLRRLKGDLEYAFSGPVDISNFATSFWLDLAGIRAHASLPAPASLLTATPLLRIGNVGGSQVGLRTTIQYADGGNKADIVSIKNNGCGGSTFDIDRITGANIGAKITDNTWPASNNVFRGGYWGDSLIGAYLKGGTQPCEGTVIDVNFILSCKYGGLWLSDGAQYTNVRGQLDFNGTWLSELAVASISGWAIGNTITCVATGAVGKIHGVYTTQGSPRLVVIETEDVSAGNSNFANGNTVTNGVASTTVSAVVTCNNAGSAFFFDIVSAFTSAASFSRLLIDAPYLGGIAGGLTWTDSIRSGNSNNSFTNGEQGAMWTNSGSLLSLYDRRKNNTSIVDISDSEFAIKRHVYLGGAGIYSERVGLTLTNGVSSDITTLPVGGPNGAVYDFQIIDPADTAMRHHARVTVAGSAAVLDGLVGPSFVTLSLSGRTVRAVQGTGVSKFVVCTWTKMSGP